MIDTAESQTHHQNDRQLHRLDKIRQVLLVVDWHQPASHTFDNGKICLPAQFCVRLQNNCNFNPDPGLFCGQMWSNSRGETIGITVFIGKGGICRLL